MQETKTILDYVVEYAPEGLKIVEVVPRKNDNSIQHKFTFRYRNLEKTMYLVECDFSTQITKFNARRAVAWVMESFAYKLDDGDLLAHWQKSPWYEKRPMSEILSGVTERDHHDNT